MMLYSFNDLLNNDSSSYENIIFKMIDPKALKNNKSYLAENN